MSDLMRVMVVDDSAYNRRTIAELLDSLPGVTVVGKAADGNEALRLAAELRPDLITLDLEMPRMDGFTFLRLLMARQPTPVIVVSGYSNKENVFRALELGALDFVAKPTRTISSDLEQIREELAEKVELVRHLSPASIDPQRRSSRFAGRTATQIIRTLPVQEPAEAAPLAQREPEHVVVVAASTGGPTALLELFASYPLGVPAALVLAQHMPEKFTRTFAERLDRIGTMKVREAVDVQRLRSGEGHVCPGGKCIEVSHTADTLVTKVGPPHESDRYVPSADRLFESAARVAGARTVAVILTGMGDDGAWGARAVKDAGGVVLAESADTAVIYGMPGAAVRAGVVDHSLPLRELAAHLARILRGQGA